MQWLAILVLCYYFSYSRTANLSHVSQYQSRDSELFHRNKLSCKFISAMMMIEGSPTWSCFLPQGNVSNSINKCNLDNGQQAE